jgi:hypothetical protein
MTRTLIPNSRVAATLCGLFAAPAVGCAASDPMGESTAEETSALAVQCGTSLSMGDCGTETTTSPDASYADPRCDDGIQPMYQVWDYTPPNVSALIKLEMKYAGPALTKKADCEYAQIFGRIAGHYQDGTISETYAWARGTWNSTTRKCSFVANQNAYLELEPGMSVIEAAAQAWGFSSYQKVTVGTSRSCTPR